MNHYRNSLSIFVDDVLGTKDTLGVKHSILILLISYPLAKILNIFISREFAFDYTIQRWGSQLDRIIWLSLTQKKEEDKLLMITTKGRKVYIGFISKLSEPIGESYITIIPNFSGFRHHDNLSLEITTNYTKVIRTYIERGKANLIDDKLGVVLPTSEILLISRFDSELFGQFNSMTHPQKKKPSRFTQFIGSFFSLRNT